MQEPVPVADERDALGESSYQETQLQEDSDLDGATWQGAESMEADDDAFAATQVIVECPQVFNHGQPPLDDDDAYAATQVDLDYTGRVSSTPQEATSCEVRGASAATAYADTQVDRAPAEMPAPASRESEAISGSQQRQHNESSLPFQDGGDRTPPMTPTQVQKDDAKDKEATSVSGDVDMNESSQQRHNSQRSEDGGGHCGTDDPAVNLQAAGARVTAVDGSGTAAWEPNKNARVIVV